MLSHGHRGDAEAPRDLGGGLRPASLELEEDALLGARVVLHEMRCVPTRDESVDPQICGYDLVYTSEYFTNYADTDKNRAPADCTKALQRVCLATGSFGVPACGR